MDLMSNLRSKDNRRYDFSIEINKLINARNIPWRVLIERRVMLRLTSIIKPILVFGSHQLWLEKVDLQWAQRYCVLWNKTGYPPVKYRSHDTKNCLRFKKNLGWNLWKCDKYLNHTQKQKKKHLKEFKTFKNKNKELIKNSKKKLFYGNLQDPQKKMIIILDLIV